MFVQEVVSKVLQLCGKMFTLLFRSIQLISFLVTSEAALLLRIDTTVNLYECPSKLDFCISHFALTIYFFRNLLKTSFVLSIE